MKRLKFEVPRWHLFLHRDARGLPRASSDDTFELKFQDELFERLYAGDAEELDVQEQEASSKAWAEKFHEEASKLGDFTRLADQCRGDTDAAATAVQALIDQLKPLLRSQQEIEERHLRNALRVGCAAAASAVDEQRDAMDGLVGVAMGVGSAPGAAGAADGTHARTLARRLKDDLRLKQIALLAGRFRRIAARKHRERTRHGADDVSDVEQGGDLARLLPLELAKLMHTRTRLAILRDLAERTALQYRLQGTEAKGKGPIVVCLDKSGSMSGPADIWATAVALALLEIAQREHRAFAVLCFDAHVRYEVLVPAGGELPAEALLVGCSGGTDIQLCLDRALTLIAENQGSIRKADVVLITDGQSDGLYAERVRTRAKDLGTSILGFGIGIPEQALLVWCDGAYAVQDLARLDDASAEALFAA